MKKKIIYVAAILVCLLSAVAGTYANYTTSDVAQNVISSGGIDISIVEHQMVDGQLRPYPDKPIPVMPAVSVSKITAVCNHDQEAWIRAKLTMTLYDPQGKTVNIPAGELEQLVVLGGEASGWTYFEGWWYYESPLATGETTTPLIESVTFSGAKMDNRYQLCTLDIDIDAQAVQKIHNGNTVWESNWLSS